jgi:hypothetical protein
MIRTNETKARRDRLREAWGIAHCTYRQHGSDVAITPIGECEGKKKAKAKHIERKSTAFPQSPAPARLRPTRDLVAHGTRRPKSGGGET